MSNNTIKLGVIKETKNRWEQRTPLVPRDVKELLKTIPNIEIYIERSPLRSFSSMQYEDSGAKVVDSLHDVHPDIILGVKEVPAESLLPNTTYMFFSHTTKAQPYNMKMLDHVLENNIALIDYEELTVDHPPNIHYKAKRLVKFGYFAGVVGLIDGLSMLGDRLLSLGMNTPLVRLAMSKNYPTMQKAKDAVTYAGNAIRDRNPWPSQLGPMIFAITGGNGDVARGSTDIFKLLPHEMISVSDLAELTKPGAKYDRSISYGLVLDGPDTTEKISDPNAPFDWNHFRSSPSEYQSKFGRDIAPHINYLANGIFWTSDYPAILTNKELLELHRQSPYPWGPRLLGVSDITCDIGGSIEFLVKATTLDNPWYVINPETLEYQDPTTSLGPDAFHGFTPGVAVLGVDNLPAAIPVDSSNHFSEHLLPLIPGLVKGVDHMKSQGLNPGSSSFSEYSTHFPGSISRATIAVGNSLTPDFQYISSLRQDPSFSFSSFTSQCIRRVLKLK